MISSGEMLEVRSWLKEAGQIALNCFNQPQVDFKHDNSPVTQADRDIESLLVERIKKAYPDHGILAEEGTNVKGGEYVWALDPIDGTRAFSVGLPFWGIAIGLLHQSQPVAGAYYMPYLNEMYWATEADGPYFNNRLLRGAIATEWDDRLMFLAVPSNAHQIYNIGFSRTRALGSAVAHLVYVARGAAIGALLRRVSLWDLAAGLPILWRAGGAIRYLSGALVDIGILLDGKPAPEP
ncbi:MAG: inositol monophosphatase, partial [Chloroflexota bacterium]